MAAPERAKRAKGTAAGATRTTSIITRTERSLSVSDLVEPAMESHVLVCYHSKTGNTKKMAEAIAEGVYEGGGKPHLTQPDQFEVAHLLDFHGYIIGSPTYYGQMAAPIKEMFDQSVVLHGRLAGRVGAAFASSANIGGGNETTCLTIAHMMMVHGMLVLGSPQGDHYGPVSVGGPPNDRVLAQCRMLGSRVAKFARRLAEARARDGKKAM